MGFFVLSLAVLLQFQVQFVSVFAMDSIVGLIVVVAYQVHPEAVILANLPSASCEDALMVTMQIVGRTSNEALLLILQNTFRHLNHLPQCFHLCNLLRGIRLDAKVLSLGDDAINEDGHFLGVEFA